MEEPEVAAEQVPLLEEAEERQYVGRDLEDSTEVEEEDNDEKEEEEGEGPTQSPIEQVALTVTTSDDPTLPVFTFRVFTLGILTCATISFVNQFFSYRTEPLHLTAMSAQIATLPLGRLMAKILPRSVRIPFLKGNFGEIQLNPGPFNVKEHVLITIFGNAGAAFGTGEVYAINTVNSIKAFYKRDISFVAAFVLVVTSHVVGYGWAGLLRKCVVNPAQMWWPSQVAKVSLFRTLHETESVKGLTRSQFFFIALTTAFAYYVVPGYLMSVVTSISWMCWLFPNSILAQQLGSGLHGLGIGAVSLDWAGTAAYLGSPLVSPWATIANIGVGAFLFLAVLAPVAYWANIFNARTFPIISTGLFQADGQNYDILNLVGDDFKLDEAAYEKYGQVHISTFLALNYGLCFAAIASTLTHVLLFHGKEIWQVSTSTITARFQDVHTRMMKKYPDVPARWFILILIATVSSSIIACYFYQADLQLPWWGVLLSVALSSTCTLPIAVLTATANQSPGLNVISEYIIGYTLPGQPIANMVFKTYSYSGTFQAVNFLADFKLGHYMKIPPRSMFAAQVLGSLINATVNLLTAWWMLSSIPNICDEDALPSGSQWTCPGGRLFYDASVLWGLLGPARLFGEGGLYRQLNWWFLGGAVLPFLVWALRKSFPKWRVIAIINIPIIVAGASQMPPATSLNLWTWVLVGTIFNFFVYNYRKAWWQRYNYVLSAALDAGTAFMGVTLYFALELPGHSLDWWGSSVDHCPLATCPTAPGVEIEGCPVF